MKALPLVLMVLNTNAWYGRGAALGILKYARNFPGWRVRFATWHELAAWPEDQAISGIIGHFANPRDSEPLLKRGIACVNLAASKEGVLASVTVWPDHRKAGYQAAEHLLSNGLKRICYLSVRKLHGRLRGEGVVEALEEQGLTLAGEWDMSRDIVKEILELRRGEERPEPIGVVVNPDLVAAGLIERTLAAGLRVPEDVAFVGIDNDTLACEAGLMPISSVDLDWVAIGYRAAEEMEGLLGGREAERPVVLVQPKGVVVRKSSDFLAVEDAEVTAALQYIRLNATKDIHVEDVCAAVAISRRSLERRFSKYLQRLPHEEILRCRLTRAKQLLAESDLPIPRVAVLSGFASGPVLAMTFRKHMGMTPTEFRATQQR